MERALQRMPPFHNPTDTSEDIVETVNSEILLHSNSHFLFSLHYDESNLHSDDGDETRKERAFKRVLTHQHLAPIIGRKRAISVMEIDIDDHHKKRKISFECIPRWTPEEATLPLRSNLTTLSTTSAELYAMFFLLPLSTSHRSLITILKRSYAMALSSYQEHPQVQTPAVPPALQPPLTRMRMPSSMVTSPTAPPQPTELVRCPSVTPSRKCR
jgi:hypothetical protein